MALKGSAAYGVFAIALMVALALGYPAVSNTAERLSGAQSAFNQDFAESRSTDIAINTTSYDGTDLVVRLDNTGTRTLSVSETDLVVDGTYVGDGDFASHAVAGTTGTDVWGPGETLRITLAVTDPQRVKVVTEHGVAVSTLVDHFFRDDDVAFTLGDDVRSATNTTFTNGYPETAQAAGPVVVNFGAVGTVKAAAVNASNDLFTVTPGGQTERLVTGVKAGTSRLTAGRWRGSKPSVFYVDSSTENLRRVTEDGQTTEIASVAADGLGGIADVDGDGADELVFGGDAGNSNEVSYVDDDGTVQQTGRSYGTNNDNIGLGEPADFNGNATARVPVVDGSNDVLLVASGGATTTVLGSGTAVKAPIGTSDVDDDGNPEIVFVSSETNANGDNAVRYVDDVTGTNTVRNLTGNTGSTLGADADAGVV